MLVEARGQNDSGDSVPSEGCKSSKMHSCDAQPREAGQQAQALVQAGQGRPGGGHRLGTGTGRRGCWLLRCDRHRTPTRLTHFSQSTENVDRRLPRPTLHFFSRSQKPLAPPVARKHITQSGRTSMDLIAITARRVRKRQ